MKKEVSTENDREEYIHQHVKLNMRFSPFYLPPIRDALVVGRRSMIGSNAVQRAFEVMSPGMFKMIKVEHPVIESVLMRESNLKKLPEKKLLEKVINIAEKIMDETDSLRVEIGIEITVHEEFESSF
ncbi:MAG: hypothetical protein DRP87_05080 [Spirochaetes bacterium]|nr:MAG: hypothetical protein DRP87_05080 [Spirochaetota bacterium]